MLAGCNLSRRALDELTGIHTATILCKISDRNFNAFHCTNCRELALPNKPLIFLVVALSSAQIAPTEQPSGY